MNKDLIIIILGRVLQIIITLLSIRLLTTFLTPEEVGNYYILLALLAFFNLVLLNPSGMYFSRHLHEWQRSKQLLNALFVFMGWMFVVSIVSVPLSAIVYNWLGYENKFDLDIFLVYIAVAMIISTIHRNVMFGSNTLGFRKEFVIYLVATLILGLLISISIVYFYYNSALGWLMGVVISEAVMLYMIFKFFIQDNQLNIAKIKSTLTKERVKKILLFALPISVTTFLMWGQTIAYRFLVDYQYSAEVLGFIAVGLGTSAAVFSSIESIAMQYFNPIFLKNILDASKEQRTKTWNTIAQQIVPIYILAAFFTLALSEVLINILVDKKFHDAYIYAMFGVTIEFFRVMSNLLNNVAQSEHKTTTTVKPYLLGFIVSLGILSSIDFGMNYFMIPLVLGIAYFLVYIYMYINMRQLLKIKYNIHLLKILFLSLPFAMIFFIDMTNSSLIFNLLVLSVFGVYFLFAVWVMIKNSKKEKI